MNLTNSVIISQNIDQNNEKSFAYVYHTNLLSIPQSNCNSGHIQLQLSLLGTPHFGIGHHILLKAYEHIFYHNDMHYATIFYFQLSFKQVNV